MVREMFVSLFSSNGDVWTEVSAAGGCYSVGSQLHLKRPRWPYLVSAWCTSQTQESTMCRNESQHDSLQCSTKLCFYVQFAGLIKVLGFALPVWWSTVGGKLSYLFVISNINLLLFTMTTFIWATTMQGLQYIQVWSHSNYMPNRRQ